MSLLFYVAISFSLVSTSPLSAPSSTVQHKSGIKRLNNHSDDFSSALYLPGSQAFPVELLPTQSIPSLYQCRQLPHPHLRTVHCLCWLSWYCDRSCSLWRSLWMAAWSSILREMGIANVNFIKLKKKIVAHFHIYCQISFPVVISSLTPMRSSHLPHNFFPNKLCHLFLNKLLEVTSFLTKNLSSQWKVTAQALTFPIMPLISAECDLKDKLNGRTLLQSFWESWLQIHRCYSYIWKNI